MKFIFFESHKAKSVLAEYATLNLTFAKQVYIKRSLQVTSYLCTPIIAGISDFIPRFACT